jgi:hypothetical protein
VQKAEESGVSGFARQLRNVRAGLIVPGSAFMDPSPLSETDRSAVFHDASAGIGVLPAWAVPPLSSVYDWHLA